MKFPTTKPTPMKLKDNPFAKLDAILKREEEPTGHEWFTVEEFSEHYRISYTQASQILRDLLKNGKLERWKGTAADTRRTLCKYKAK